VNTLNQSGYIMRVLICVVILSITVLSCDAVEPSFDEAVPGMYSIHTEVSPIGSGSIDPSEGDFITGTRVRIEAIPENGYVFDRWEGDITGNTNPVTLTVNQNTSVTALFSEIVGPYVEIIQQPSDIEAGQPIQPAPEVKYYDVRGDPAGNIEILARLSHEHFQSESETSVYTNSDGIARFENLIIEKANSDYTIIFETDTLTGVTSQFTVKPSAVDAENSIIRAEPASPEVGHGAVVFVELRDQFNNLVGGLENHDFEVSVDGEASPGIVNETDESGIYSFEVTNQKSEKVQVSVSVLGELIDEITEITFKPGRPDKQEILVQPKNTNRGDPIEGPPTVQVTDQFGNGVNQIRVRVREENNRQFTSGSLVVDTDESGVAVFDDLVIDGFFGNYRLVFSVENLPDITSETFRVRSFGFNESDL
jgi:hypothetical protein